MKHEKLTMLIRCAVFAAILCILSPIAVYIGPIPYTLQVFAVMLCGAVLDLKSGMISVLVYLALSLCGLPLFSGGHSGLTAIPGPTGGYIWSFVLMIPVICLFRKIPVRHRSLTILTCFIGCIVSLAVCYACGTLQYSILAGVGFQEALSICVLDFFIPDLIKALAASVLGTALRTLLLKLGYVS